MRGYEMSRHGFCVAKRMGERQKKDKRILQKWRKLGGSEVCMANLLAQLLWSCAMPPSRLP